jgi:hypothetical protein
MRRDLLNAPAVSVRVAEESTPDQVKRLSLASGSICSRVEYLDLPHLDTTPCDLITRRTYVLNDQEQVV